LTTLDGDVHILYGRQGIFADDVVVIGRIYVPIVFLTYGSDPFAINEIPVSFHLAH